jgi:hypothetical protein
MCLIEPLAFNLVQQKVSTVARMTPGLVRAYVSFGRIQKFLVEVSRSHQCVRTILTEGRSLD